VSGDIHRVKDPSEGRNANHEGTTVVGFESSIYSFAATVLSTSRTGNGNRFREGSRTTFGAESWYLFTRVFKFAATRTFFTLSNWLVTWA
jgi:hypothetical protein